MTQAWTVPTQTIHYWMTLSKGWTKIHTLIYDRWFFYTFLAFSFCLYWFYYSNIGFSLFCLIFLGISGFFCVCFSVCLCILWLSWVFHCLSRFFSCSFFLICFLVFLTFLYNSWYWCYYMHTLSGYVNYHMWNFLI